MRTASGTVGLAAIAWLTWASVVSGQERFEVAKGTFVEPLEAFQECDLCPEMVDIPLGSFMMGAVPGESSNPFDIYGPSASLRVRVPDEIDIIPHEHPRHFVSMETPYAIGRNEVTGMDGVCRRWGVFS